MVGARRTRAAGASPGGFKSLDDIPKKTTRGKGRRIKTEPIEPSIESESSDPFIIPAEANNNTESQKTQSSPTNASRTNSPDSQSPSPTAGDSRSTSPPPKNNIAFNDASSDNDVINHEQAAPRIAPLESKKRSREDEASTHQSAGITNTEEDVEQRSSKRTRRQQSSGVEDVAAEAEKSTEPELEPKKKSRGRPSNRAKASPKKPPTKTRGRKQDPIVLNDDSGSDDEAETTVSPLQSRSTSTPKQAVTPSPHTPHQQETSSAEDEPQVGPSTISYPTSTLTLPPPDLRAVPQTEVKQTAPSLTETGPTPSKSRPNLSVPRGFPLSNYKLTPGMSKTDRLRLMYGIPSPNKGKEVVKEVAQGANDVAHQSERKTTAVASSSENLSKPDVPHSANQSPRDGLRLTDPYLVAVAKVFTNHKDKSRALPSIEQVTAFLTTFDAQQPLYNPKAQMVTQKPTRPPQPKKPKRSGYAVPDTDSDDTDMSDEEEAQVVDEPKTPEAQISPSQDASPKNSWWTPISTFTSLITSPFRKQSTDVPAPLSGNKLVPPFIFNQPPTTPAAVPLKRMSHSDRKRNTRNNVQGRLAGFQTELHPRHRDVEKTPVHVSGLLTAAEVREIHRAQDEYAAKHRGKGPSIEANQDIHKNARASQRAAVTTPVEGETSAFTQAKAGEKRDADGAPKVPTQRWNDFLRKETRSDSDFGPRWIRCRNGLYIRENCTDRQFEFNHIVTDNDPCWEDHYRDIDAFPKQDVFKPAGVQNPLNSAQLLEQAHLRARGVAGIPDESENDYTYVIDEQQKRLLFYPRSPYNMFQIPGKRLTRDHIENIKEGLPLLNPRDEYGIAIKTPAFDSTRPSREQTTTNVFQQLHDWDKKYYYKDAVEMKAGRILEPKQWSQTPPPKPKPGNAKLPGAVEQTPAPISEAVKHAMSRANKYLPAKGSGLRQVSNMSPLQAEQDRVMEAVKESKPMFNFDFSDESLGFHVDPLVKECVLERLGEGYVPITPIPDHIWHEHDDLQLGEVERAVAKLFEGIDPRLFGSMHNGIKVPEQPNMAIEFTSESPTNRPALKLW